MSVQDDKGTDRAEKADQTDQEEERRPTEKPEPDGDDKRIRTIGSRVEPQMLIKPIKTMMSNG